MISKTITITEKEYDKLREDSKMLNALREAGVDNWDGYSEAMRIVYGDDEEEYDDE